MNFHTRMIEFQQLYICIHAHNVQRICIRMYIHMHELTDIYDRNSRGLYMYKRTCIHEHIHMHELTDMDDRASRAFERTTLSESMAVYMYVCMYVRLSALERMKLMQIYICIYVCVCVCI